MGSYQSATARGIFYLSAGSSSPAQRLTSGRDTETAAAPSKDDHRVVFQRDGRLFLVAVDGGKLRCSVRALRDRSTHRPLCPLTPRHRGARQSRDADPTWSWDGRWIAFRRTFDGGTSALMRLDVANPRDVRVLGKGAGPFENAPVWSHR